MGVDLEAVWQTLALFDKNLKITDNKRHIQNVIRNLLARISKNGDHLMARKKKPLTYGDYARGIQSLKPEEQLSLVEIISTRLKRTLGGKKTEHSLLELEGLGAEMWNRIDAQEYFRRERESWD